MEKAYGLVRLYIAQDRFKTVYDNNLTVDYVDIKSSTSFASVCKSFLNGAPLRWDVSLFVHGISASMRSEALLWKYELLLVPTHLFKSYYECWSLIYLSYRSAGCQLDCAACDDVCEFVCTYMMQFISQHALALLVHLLTNLLSFQIGLHCNYMTGINSQLYNLRSQQTEGHNRVFRQPFIPSMHGKLDHKP